MEVHPILEHSDRPKPNLWYALSPDGATPSVRVGHTCTFQPGAGGNKNAGRVLVIGGATPDGPFADVFVLNLDSYNWSKPEWQGLISRYEHSAFIPLSLPNNVVVFGGAQQTKNLNDIQVLETDKGVWSSVPVTGEAPTPRTCHSMTSVRDQLYVFGGGHSGPDPVQDNEMHLYDAVKSSWSQVKTSGEKPCSRHGHVMVAMGTYTYLHGGMAGTNVYNDLYRFNTENSTWRKLQPLGDIPPSRTAHAGTTIGNYFFIFGGMSEVGTALDDFYMLDTEKMKWTRIKTDGLPPNPRLDHTMCTIMLSRPLEEAPEAGSNEKDDTLTLVFVFGGVDTRGQIFNDCFVFLPNFGTET